MLQILLITHILTCFWIYIGSMGARDDDHEKKEGWMFMEDNGLTSDTKPIIEQFLE